MSWKMFKEIIRDGLFPSQAIRRFIKEMAEIESGIFRTDVNGGQVIPPTTTSK